MQIYHKTNPKNLILPSSTKCSVSNFHIKELTETTKHMTPRFNNHISILCSKAAMQLSALSRLQIYMGKSEKEAIINSLILSNFNYCPLVWHFGSCESIRKIEKIQKRCLRIILNDYESDYETLLRNSNKPTMEIRRLRTLVAET